jgi:AcrR family transcriptional regulator
VPRRADARRNRDLVLQAAADVLAERPDASMQDVAEASGLGRTTVYRHFRHRDDLVHALLGQVFDEARAIVDAALARSREAWTTGPTPGEGLRAVVALAVELADLGVRYRFVGGHRDAFDDEVREQEALHGPDPLRAYAAEAQERGELRDDVPAEWVVDVVHALTMAAARRRSADAAADAEAGRMLERTLRGALAPPSGD